MFVFGHLGIGSALVKLRWRSLPAGWLLLGTVFPDVLDKPVYWALTRITGLHGAQLGWFAGGRLFGHTLVLCAVLGWIGYRRHSKALLALTSGAVVHLALDAGMDALASWLAPELIPSGAGAASSSGWIALFWPLLGFGFPVQPHAGTGSHLRVYLHPVFIAPELVGLTLLLLRIREARSFFSRR